MLKPNDVRGSLEDLIALSVAPVARRYDYDALSLNPRANWKPLVLFIGNYSSGKSTLINEIVGAPVQRTGQAPTDDCFTVITGPEGDIPPSVAGVLEEVPGRTLVNDPALPFGEFLKFGSRFVSHFLMKRVASPKLRDLALIDSPGMLDSVAEMDRGYDYQEVIGRFAELADLVVLCFDPHRAGTIKETYVSIRSTLPEATSEDRVVFVMNRIDECKNLIDLVRCYGVLCWNLSQMTGRKDIPRIFLTYSREAGTGDDAFAELAGERDELLAKIEQAPRLQVSHLLGMADHHLRRLRLIAGTLGNVAARWRRAVIGYWQVALAAIVGGAVALDVVLAVLLGQAARSSIGRLFGGNLVDWPLLLPIGLVLLGLGAATVHFRRHWRPGRQARLLAELDDCADLGTRYARDMWEAARPKARELLGQRRNLGLFVTHGAQVARLDAAMEELRQLYRQHLDANPADPGAMGRWAEDPRGDRA